MSWVADVLAAERVPPRTRLVLSLLAGLMAGQVTIQTNQTYHGARDFAQVWFAARSILHGVDPYPLVGPGLALDWQWPLLYPLTAGVAAIPLAPLSAEWASVVFMAIGGACLAWALMEHGYAPLFGFFGTPLHFAAGMGQWSPLFTASVVVSPLAFFLVCKPTIGLAYWIARPSRWAVVGALVLGGIAFAVQPGWVHEWLSNVARNNADWAPDRPYQTPISLPGGFLILLALLRWRRPEARLLAVLACIPQTMMLYEAVPLLLVPRTFKETASFVGLSFLALVLIMFKVGPVSVLSEYLAVSGPVMIALLYLPATLLVLRRPNEGTVPAWLERRIPAWPEWLRGTSARA